MTEYRKFDGKRFELFGIINRKDSAKKIKRQLQAGDKLVRLVKVKMGWNIWIYQKRTAQHKRDWKNRRFQYLEK